jgi:hypothetical protein
MRVAICALAELPIGTEVDSIEKRSSETEVARGSEEGGVALGIAGGMLFANIVVARHDEDVLGLDWTTENLRDAGEEVKPLLLSTVREITGDDDGLDLIEVAGGSQRVERRLEHIALSKAITRERPTMVVKVLSGGDRAKVEIGEVENAPARRQ